MIDEVRKKENTYKVIENPTQPLEYDIAIWRLGHYPDKITPNPPLRFKQRKDTLPSWVIEGMQVLDAAGEDVVVPFFGDKVGHVYWFWADQYYISAGFKKEDYTIPVQLTQQLTPTKK